MYIRDATCTRCIVRHIDMSHWDFGNLTRNETNERTGCEYSSAITKNHKTLIAFGRIINWRKFSFRTVSQIDAMINLLRLFCFCIDTAANRNGELISVKCMCRTFYSFPYARLDFIELNASTICTLIQQRASVADIHIHIRRRNGAPKRFQLVTNNMRIRKTVSKDKIFYRYYYSLHSGFIYVL